MPGKLDAVKANLIEGALAEVGRVGADLAADQAEILARMIPGYFRRVAAEDLYQWQPLDLYGVVASHWQLARERPPGTTRLRFYTPNVDEHHWQSSHSVVEIVTDDMPFLVDSVTAELTRQGYDIHRVIHPIFFIRRNEDGGLVSAGPDEVDEMVSRESFIHVEFDRQTDRVALDALRHGLDRVLADVRVANEDAAVMAAQAASLADALGTETPSVPAADLAEAQALLRWMAEGHFTFLGFRHYTLATSDGGDVLRAVPGSGLGILREGHRGGSVEGGNSESFARLTPALRRLARVPELLILAKADAVSTVHRPVHLDYVGVKRFDESGAVIGERRFLGLYSSAVYNSRPVGIPVLRRKVQAVLDRAGLDLRSHDGRHLVQVLDTYPRDELFQISIDDLYDTVLGILQLQERSRVRLFTRRDSFGRFVSCLVFLPRERYTTQIRMRMQEILLQALGGTRVEWTTRLSESVLARFHFIVYTVSGQLPEYDLDEVEAKLADATHAWSDDLSAALVDECGEERGIRLFRRYREAFPAAYREDFPARSAVSDMERLERLNAEDDLDMSLYQPVEAAGGVLRLKLYRTGVSISLSDVLPMLQHMGVTVLDMRPYDIERDGKPPAWIYDFGLQYEGELPHGLDPGRLRSDFQDAFLRIWRGEIDSDGFNRLTLRAGLTWREVGVLRAYCRYLRQTGTPFSQAYMEDTLASHPDFARLLAQMFRIRFDPDGPSDREGQAATLAAKAERALDAVGSLDQDRILRSYVRLIQATLRTNHFQIKAGAPKAYLSLKFDSRRIPDLPLPRPMFEIFVYSTRMEGVHLRSGPVARGGLRWSDRRADFRTEILGLMKAQTVKNAVIVPVGAKGGFVVKQPPAGGSGDALAAEVVHCYSTLIRGLLDLTDNLNGSNVVPPDRVLCYDRPDSYLVVAADKGTAAFSDIANDIAAEYGFWLGDAFASGGSSGYDHKAMGITARGAWESINRSFGELGVNIRETDFTVIGIGDMSGDVFGNGMLLSRRVKLVAAFDHRHIFLDPDPDPGRSWQERSRLFGLPHSSWADYDRGALSEGGGVFPRTAKSIQLTPQAASALGTEVRAMTPNDLIRTILRAPVDLLWNGGIGTYVKAQSETHAEVGDKGNDPVRVDAGELRCQVVGEGGNLGVTQRGRLEYALGGGRIHTDAIDNSAGVDCSDHEVNIKILLDAVTGTGDLTHKQRNKLLREMTDEVADLVLRDNYRQAQALATTQAQAPTLLHMHVRCMEGLERRGALDRDLACLPGAEAIAERRAAGQGLVTPEFAVLMAYTKIVVTEDLLRSDLPEDRYLSRVIEEYFPAVLRKRWADRMPGHRLRREIIATRVANSLVNRAGISFVHRLSEEMDVPISEIARAHIVAREVFGMPAFWQQVDALDDEVPPGVQTTLLVETRSLLERATRWLLRTRTQPFDVGENIEYFRPGVSKLLDRLPELLTRDEESPVDVAAARFRAAGVPADVATRAATLAAAFATLDIVECAVAGYPLETVAAVYFELAIPLGISWLGDQITALPRQDRWQTRARAALREDLATAHRAVTMAVLTQEGPEAAALRVDNWLAGNAAAVGRCRHLLADMRSADQHHLATLSVAVRELRGLIPRTA